ncbi:MAG: CvpA family protein [Phycisphaeraceae bacterium]|nr:CvpA family protein [Phycisphaeraceae bacterium]
MALWANLLALGVAALITYLWMIRGFFSALLHLVCVVIAGAIAFAVWEPLAHLILNKAPHKGFLGFLGEGAWGIALILPFALSLAVLRMIVDKMVPANANTEKTMNVVGGGICGLGSGILTSGILVIGGGMLWVNSGNGFIGYKRLTFDSTSGQLRTTGHLWLRFDELTAGFYGKLSQTTLATEQALGTLYPRLADVPGAMQLSLDKGRGRITLATKDFSLVSRYTVGVDINGRPFDGANPAEYLRDSFNTNDDPVTDRNGENLLKSGAYLAGYTVRYNSTARENGSGQVVSSVGQVRLVCENADGDAREMFPVAIVCRTAQAEVILARHRYKGEFYPASTTESQPTMIYEFVVPSGFSPAWLYVKNVRVDVRSGDYHRYTSQHDRERAIRDLSILEESRRVFDESKAVTVNVNANNLRALGITISDRLPRVTIQDGRQGALTVNDRKQITDGEQSYGSNELPNARDIDKALRIDTFAVTAGNGMVQLLMTPSNQVTAPACNLLVSPLVDAPKDLPIDLIDENGTSYACIGYLYGDRRRVTIRYTRSDRLDGLLDLPTVPTRSRSDQEITLLFEATLDAKIVALAIGDSIYTKFGDGFTVTRRP